MIRKLLSIAFLVYAGTAGSSQLPAPTAISDVGYNTCSHDSCLFVPDHDHPKTYRRGDLSYSVEVPPSDEGGRFVLRRNQRILLTTPLKDLSASVFVAWSAHSDWFAVTWSDGGAIGNFHTRVFQIDGDLVKETEAVAKSFTEFRSRHSCKARGENVQAYGWNRNGDLLLVMSVYPTGDCGRESGHTEAYLVQPSDGTILQHFTSQQLNLYAKQHPQ